MYITRFGDSTTPATDAFSADSLRASCAGALGDKWTALTPDQQNQVIATMQANHDLSYGDALAKVQGGKSTMYIVGGVVVLALVIGGFLMFGHKKHARRRRRNRK